MVDWVDLDIPDTDFDVGRLAAALAERRHARGISWKAVADEVSRRAERPDSRHPISPSTIRGLAQRRWGVEGDGVLQMMIWLDRMPESFVPGHPGADRPEANLPRPEATKILRFDVSAIHAALDRTRADLGLSWHEVAAQVGGNYNAQTLQDMSNRSRTSFPRVVRLARWLRRPCASLTHVVSR